MIIGITGTLGSGKGTVVEYLVKEKGFKHFSVSGFLTEEINRRGLAVNRDTMTLVGNDLRATFGPGYITEQLLARAGKEPGNIVIESIRSMGEVETLKKAGAVLWAVDADIRTRYERVAQRASEKDHVSFEKFIADEERESHNEDPRKMNLPKCIAHADVVFRNDASREELFAQVERAFSAIG